MAWYICYFTKNGCQKPNEFGGIFKQFKDSELHLVRKKIQELVGKGVIHEDIIVFPPDSRLEDPDKDAFIEEALAEKSTTLETEGTNESNRSCRVINGNCHSSETDFAVRVYREDDGTWDVDVYERDERDCELGHSGMSSKELATAYAEGVAEVLKRLGTVAFAVAPDQENAALVPTPRICPKCSADNLCAEINMTVKVGLDSSGRPDDIRDSEETLLDGATYALDMEPQRIDLWVCNCCGHEWKGE